MMRLTRFGKTELDVSVVSLGTWALGGDFFGEVDEKESIAAIQAAVDAGINLIDTAPAYGAGYSEQIVGKALVGRRDKVFISTKCGTVRAPDHYYQDLRPASIRKQLEDSLTYLQTDYIDLYLLHWPDPEVPIGETMEEIVRLKEAGYFRHFGVSNFNEEQIEAIEAYLPVEAFQPQYSILVREKKAIIDFAAAKDIGVMSYGPLAGGMLTGKFTDPPAFDEKDTRNDFYPFFREPLWSRAHALVEELKKLSGELGRPLAQIAINYVAQQEGIETVLVGAKKPEQARANAGAGDWLLTEEAIAFIDSAAQRYGFA